MTNNTYMDSTSYMIDCFIQTLKPSIYLYECNGSLCNLWLVCSRVHNHSIRQRRSWNQRGCSSRTGEFKWCNRPEKKAILSNESTWTLFPNLALIPLTPFPSYFKKYRESVLRSFHRYKCLHVTRQLSSNVQKAVSISWLERIWLSDRPNYVNIGVR